MNLEGRKSNIYYDETGKQILVGDLLKVYHYGNGNKTRYMYHVAVMEETQDFPVMSIRHYNYIKPHCRLYVVCDNDNRMYYGAKIISEMFNGDTKRLKIKLTK